MSTTIERPVEEDSLIAENRLRTLPEEIATTFRRLYGEELEGEDAKKKAFRDLAGLLRLYLEFHRWAGEMGDRRALDFSRAVREIEERAEDLGLEVDDWQRHFCEDLCFRFAEDDAGRVPGLPLLSSLTTRLFEPSPRAYEAVDVARFPQTRF